jgi:hypothetical protein
MSIFRAGGSYAFPLIGIFLVLAALWALFGIFFALIPDFADGHLRRSHFSPSCDVSLHPAKLQRSQSYNLSQELLKPSPLDPHRLYLSIYPWAETHTE